MVTIDQVKGILKRYNYDISDLEIQVAVDSVNSVEECLVGSGLSDSQVTLVQAYAAALMCGAGGGAQIASQGAPSGASRSFRYGPDGIDKLLDKIAVLDTAGCLTSLIPVTSNVMFFVTC